MEFFLNGAELSLNPVNSGNLINHWSMNWAQRSCLSHLSWWHCGSILFSYTRGGWVAGSSPFNYRPQQSWGKVMFLHLSVILFTGRRCLADTPSQADICPGRHPWADTLPGRHTPRQTHSQADTPLADTPLGRQPPRQTFQGRHSPRGRWLLQRTVRIVLEYILVTNIFCHWICWIQWKCLRNILGIIIYIDVYWGFLTCKECVCSFVIQSNLKIYLALT